MSDSIQVGSARPAEPGFSGNTMIPAAPELTRVLVEASPIGVWQTDHAGHTIIANPAMVQMLELPDVESLRGQSIHQFLAPESLAAIQQGQTRLSAGISDSHEVVLIGARGRTLHLLATSVVIQTAAGEIASCIYQFVDVTRLKLAAARSLENADLVRAVVEEQPDMIVRWKPDGTRLFVNQAYAKNFGQSVEALTGTNFFPLVDPQDLPQLRRKFRSLTPDHPVATDIHRALLPSGEIQWQEWIDRATFNHHGEMVELISVGRDISERKRAEELLQQNEERLRLVMEATNDGVWEWNIETGGVVWSARMYEMLGLVPGSLGLNFEGFKDQMHPDDQSPFSSALRQHLYHGKPFNMELRLRRIDNAYGHYLLRGKAQYDTPGKPLRMVGAVADITERTRAGTALRDSEARLSALVENAPGIIWSVDRQYRYLSFNSLFRQYIQDSVGHTPEVGAGIDTILTPEHASYWRRHYDRAFNGERFATKLSMSVGGASHEYEISLSPIISAGAITGVTVFGHDITRRMEAEGELRRSEERYRRLIEDARDAIFTLSPEGIITSLNHAVEEIAEWNPEDWIGRNFSPLIHPADQLTALGFFQQVMQGNEPIPFELRVVKKHGGFADVEFTVTPQFEDGRVIGVLGIGRDLTERKQTKLQLEQERNQLRTLIDNLPACIYIKDTDGCYVITNQANTRTLQLESDSQVLGKTVFDLFPPGIAQAYDQDDKLVIATGRAVVNREEPYDVDGKRGWFSTSKIPLHDIAGNIIGIVGISRDTTLEKLEELERIRLITAVEQSADSIIMLSPDGRIEFVNPAFARITGRLREEVIGLSYDQLLKDQGVRLSFRQITEQIARAAVWTGRIAAQRKDGLRFEHESSISAIHDASGQIINYLSINRDVSKVAELEEQVRQSQKMDAIGQLAGGVAHDFNNILTVIEGHASLIQSGGPSADIADSAREISLASSRAANLTRQLLTFSRRQVMQPKSLDLNEVVADMTKMLRRILGEDIELKLECHSSLPLILADFGMIQQILLNLAVNSRDAMPRGGRLIISTGTEIVDGTKAHHPSDVSCGEFVVLTVADTGCGISPDNLGRIFEPFFTTKEVGKGTGLGLATVYGIVKQHQGWVTVESNLGAGTRFQIHLPGTRVRTLGNTEMFIRREVRGGSETILLVEDEASVRTLARHSLGRLGYNIIEASSGAAALKLAEHVIQQIDLLLTDLVMPDGVDGRQLAERLQAEKPGLKVIFSSGYSADVAGKDFVLDPNLNFLQKPYHPRQLAITVRDCLDAVKID